MVMDEANGHFLNETHAGIIRPIPAPKGMRYNNEVTIDSPLWQKLACVALRRYQSKECQDGMKWDVSDSGWADIIAFTFTEEHLPIINSSQTRNSLIGLVTMNVSNTDTPYLSTVWIHPFYRRRGLLSGLWPVLKERFGDFDIEEPNSNMRAFIAAKNGTANTK